MYLTLIPHPPDFSRQQRKMDLGGLFGSVTYDPEALAFYPLLWLGQFIQVGNNTAFGLGRYLLHG